MKLNKEKLDQMVEAVSKQLEFMWDIVDRELEEDRLRKTLTPFCMEMTDEEIIENMSHLPHMTQEGLRLIVYGAKFIRDGNK